MVIPRMPRAQRRRAFASIDLFLAMAIFLVGFFSIAYLSTREMKLARAYYFDAIAMSLVDGELEVLAAGAWRGLPIGESPYRSPASTMKSLPPGEFRATRRDQLVRLEWIPASRGNGRQIIREFALAATSAPAR